MILRAFAWICDKENRKIIEIIVTDVTQDAREMPEEGYSEVFIQAVVLWRGVAKGDRCSYRNAQSTTYEGSPLKHLKANFVFVWA